MTACHLQATSVRLLDGREYTFRSLPLKPDTAEILSVVLGDSKDHGLILRCLAQALQKSLSYDQTPEEVERILDSGLIPSKAGGPDDDIRKAVMRAVFAGFAS